MTNAIDLTPETLRQVSLLTCFSPQQLGQIISLGETRTYDAFSNIITEGEESWSLFIILEGVVGIFKSNKLTGDVHDVAQLLAGNFFGEMSLVDRAPRSASARAMTPCRLFQVSRENLEQFLNSSSDLKVRFYENCVSTLVGRLRDLDDNYVISQYQLWKVALRQKGATL